MSNQRYEGRCLGLDEYGKSRVEIQGRECAVSGLLPGETGEFEFVKRNKGPVPQLVRVTTKAKQRVVPRCPQFNQCGGCQLQHLSYEGQLAWKQSLAEELLGEFFPKGKGGLSPIIGMQEPWRYRNKIHSTLALDAQGRVISGIYQEDSHQVVPNDTCLIQDEYADKVVASVRAAMRTCKLRPYDEDSGKGLVRHILVRRGFATGQTMVVLVTASSIFPGRSNFVDALRKSQPQITTIVMNINPRKTSMVLGEQERVLFGKGYIEDVLCGKTFKISPKSFYQVNPVQTELLYNKALELADLTGNETVVDAYCGIGTISLIAAEKANQVIGVELNRDAVRDAIRNAKRNQTANVTFCEGDAGEFLTRFAADGKKATVVFLDPPRSGSDEAFLSSICKLAPEKVVYISCNLLSQQRDLRYLTQRGYVVKAAQPVDLFPQTGHVECCVLLAKR